MSDPHEMLTPFGAHVLINREALSHFDAALAKRTHEFVRFTDSGSPRNADVAPGVRRLLARRAVRPRRGGPGEALCLPCSPLSCRKSQGQSSHGGPALHTWRLHQTKRRTAMKAMVLHHPGQQLQFDHGGHDGCGMV